MTAASLRAGSCRSVSGPFEAVTSISILFRLTAIVSKIPCPERGWDNGSAECQPREGLGHRCAVNGIPLRRKGTAYLEAKVAEQIP